VGATPHQRLFSRRRDPGHVRPLGQGEGRPGAGVGILAPFDTSLDVPGLHWIPLRDAAPVQICVVQRRDTLPSPSALIVRRLINERAGELLEPVVTSGHQGPC
jgi:hypothetical protein